MTYVSISDYITNNKTNYKDYIILDVRGDDFKGGNLKNAQNIKSTNYNEIKLFVHDKDNIIVHCMYSNVRGPGVAKLLKRDYPVKNIMILTGGFNKFFNDMINLDKNMIQNLDLIFWKKNKEQIWKHIND